MIKYLSAAAGLKLFSLNQTTRSAYRAIGNNLGQKRRKSQSIDAYIQRGDLLIALADEHGLLEKPVSALEIGTGWMHWFGLYFALHAKETESLALYDVWDNRQFEAMQSAFSALQQHWGGGGQNSERDQRLNTLLQQTSFESLYTAFNANYTYDGEGSLASYADAAHDVVFSFHVLEHIGRDIIHNSIADMYRTLKPGGLAIHQIGIDDHLTHYDKAQSQKEYLRYSMAMRKRLFENVVQYHNVLQAQDYIQLFQDQGFELLSEHRETTDISHLNIHKDWQHYSDQDLETTILTLVCRKPEV